MTAVSRKRGLILVNARRVTPSVFINDDERGLRQDIDDWLEELAVHESISCYRHNRSRKNSTLLRGATRFAMTAHP